LNLRLIDLLNSKDKNGSLWFSIKNKNGEDEIKQVPNNNQSYAAHLKI
jgi:hypothetical protein